MTKKILMIFLMLLACISIASATVTHTITRPANLMTTTETSVNFTWTPASTTTNTNGMTTWFYLSKVNNDTVVLNQTVAVTNNTWRNITISSLSTGFYKWQLKTNDSDGNSTATARWFEIRGSSNESEFHFENESGNEAVIIDADTGNVDIKGNLIVRKNLTVLGTEAIINVTSFSVNGSISPGLTNTFNLGSLSYIWNTVFATSAYISTNITTAKITVTDITCFNSACTFYMNATSGCQHFPSGGKLCDST